MRVRRHFLLAGLLCGVLSPPAHPTAVPDDERSTVASSASSNDSLVSAIARAMSGTWRLEGDPELTRTFADDGTLIDRREADASSSTRGQWHLFTAADRDPLLDSAVAGVTYLRLEEYGDVTFYVVVHVDRRHLRLRYADRRGYSVEFTRVRRGH